MAKVGGGRLWEPFGLPPPPTTRRPTNTTKEYNDEILGQFTHVMSNSTLNEIKVGKTAFGLANTNLTHWSNHWQKANGITAGSPRSRLRVF
jgi:hypothetical protein